jgi:hypothetical protein
MLNVPDIINGCFEAFGAVAAFINIVTLYKHKTVKGTYWPSSFFWATWGIWNVYFYWHLAQWFSLVAGACLAIMTAIWLIMAIYYIKVKGYE